MRDIWEVVVSCFNGKRQYFFWQEAEGSKFKTSEEKVFKLRIQSEDPGMKNTGCLFYRVSEYGSFII